MTLNGAMDYHIGFPLTLKPTHCARYPSELSGLGPALDRANRDMDSLHHLRYYEGTVLKGVFKFDNALQVRQLSNSPPSRTPKRWSPGPVGAGILVARTCLTYCSSMVWPDSERRLIHTHQRGRLSVLCRCCPEQPPSARRSGRDPAPECRSVGSTYRINSLPDYGFYLGGFRVTRTYPLSLYLLYHFGCGSKKPRVLFSDCASK